MNPRQEADERYPDIDGMPPAITASHRDAFVAGARWVAEQIAEAIRAERRTPDHPLRGPHDDTWDAALNHAAKVAEEAGR